MYTNSIAQVMLLFRQAAEDIFHEDQRGVIKCLKGKVDSRFHFFVFQKVIFKFCVVFSSVVHLVMLEILWHFYS